MAVLGVVGVDMYKSLVQAHAAQLRQVSLDVAAQDGVINCRRRERPAVKVHRQPLQVLARRRASDAGIVRDASRPAGHDHRRLQDAAHFFGEVKQLRAVHIQTAAAPAGQLSPSEVSRETIVAHINRPT